MADVLTTAQVDSALSALSGWALERGKLHKEFRFANFGEAFGFMARVALIAEKLDHHPDWSNSWNVVVVDIVNHAAGGITQRCVDLAVAVEAVAGAAGSPA